ncbi:MAG: MBL fold metallo-hydrolase [Gammaproteobacteria bacterium]|nr:MBL fold metallo-hydrolase [Gammaproteobacteria bacterium]
MLRILLAIPVIIYMILGAPPLSAKPAEIDNGAVRLIPVADGIYAVLPNFAGANGAVILNDSGHVVVDSHGTPASARALIDAVATISSTPIRYVINTHWHVDHHSGNAAYKAAYGDDVIFLSHELTREDIPTLGAEQFGQVAAYRATPIQAADDALAAKVDAHGNPLSREQTKAIETFRDQQRVFAVAGDYRYTLAHLTFSDSMTLHGNPHRIEVMFLHPAHTRSDAIVYIPEQQILIVGDLLTQPILWTWSSYPAGYVKTLKTLEALPAKKILIGHGGPVLEDKSYLILARQFLEAIVNHATTLHSKGVSEDDTIASAAENNDIQAFRRRFVTEESDGMFDQMVGWSVARAWLELTDRSQ